MADEEEEAFNRKGRRMGLMPECVSDACYGQAVAYSFPSRLCRTHGMNSLNWPGAATCITPPQRQFSVETLSRDGWFPRRTVTAPGTQGVIVTGMHGCGVRTPKAAAVAAATAGLAMLVHAPKGWIFTMGLWSMMVAAGWLFVITLLTGRTASWLGARPKLHVNIAQLQT
jgi:hypothetical protein